MLPSLSGFIWQIVAGVVATGTVAILSYVFKSEIVRKWRRTKNYIFDSKVDVNLTRIDRYTDPPTRSLDMSFFNELKQDIDGITFEGLSDDCLKVSIPGISTPIEVRIENEPSFDDPHGNSEKFELRVETQNSMTFGYRSDESLRAFERVASDISSRAEENFQDSPSTTFLTGTLFGQTPVTDGVIEDEDLEMRAVFKDSTLEMRFSDPRLLSRGIRKYFTPIQ